MGILRQMFGPSRNDVWKQLCDETGASFVDGGFWKGGKVQAKVGDWMITLDTFTVSSDKHSTTYTRMRAPYVNKDGFRFTIYRKGFFSGLGKMFGMQDVEVGHPRFDEDFIIKGNDEKKLRALFGNATLRQVLDLQPHIHLTVKDDEGWFSKSFPDGVDELCFQVAYVIKDVEQLKSLYELFAVTLHQLCQIGSAYESDPEVEL